MCLSMPGKVVAIKGDLASVDYGTLGMRGNVNITLVDAKLGDYVLVQGGFAIKLLTDQEAKESLEAWRLVQEAAEELEEAA